MSNLLSVFKDFFQNLPEIMNKISTFANRNGISSEAALILVAIFETDFKAAEYIKEEHIDELIKNDLIIDKTNLALTKKGTILAKFYVEILSKS